MADRALHRRHDRRAVLLLLAGDAAHCASPYSGMGISGGLVGAYVLAGGINRSPDDLPTAFARYDTTLRLGIPKTRFAIRILQTVAALAVKLRIVELVARYSAEDRGGDGKLPEYPHATAQSPAH